MNKAVNNSNKLAKQMAIAMILGLGCGLGFLMLRENLITNGDVKTWSIINNLLFQDISAQGAEKSLGIFYILGQLFINSLQLVIVPMIFTSIALAISNISDTKKLGRISRKTILTFLFTSTVALIIAGIVGLCLYSMGAFNTVNVGDITIGSGASGTNPLNIILSVIPINIISIFSVNNKVLAVVFVAVSVGLCMNFTKSKGVSLKKIMLEVNEMITIFLTFIINKFGPYAIFILLTRTFAIYGINHLMPALAYVVSTVATLLFYLIFGYALFIAVLAKLNPIPFLKKIAKVAVFGFSTSSSAATLPLNQKTTIEDLGVSEDVASFTLPLGMTINMDGTAIMQVIATIFIAVSSGYEISFISIATIAILALVASIGTPAAPGAGAIILFTILTGMGYTNDSALLAYSLILAINRPIEMLVTSLNVVGDSATAIIVAKSEGTLNEEIYNA